MTRKELDQKYETALAYHIGKGGVETNMMFAMDYYMEFLEEATAKHPKFLNAHLAMAQLSRKMGDMSRESNMKDEAKEWYDSAREHYETILVEYKNVQFNDRILAEYEYEKFQEDMKNGGKKSFLRRLFGLK